MLPSLLYFPGLLALGQVRELIFFKAEKCKSLLEAAFELQDTYSLQVILQCLIDAKEMESIQVQIVKICVT